MFWWDEPTIIREGDFLTAASRCFFKQSAMTLKSRNVHLEIKVRSNGPVTKATCVDAGPWLGNLTGSPGPMVRKSAHIFKIPIFIGNHVKYYLKSISSINLFSEQITKFPSPQFPIVDTPGFGADDILEENR